MLVLDDHFVSAAVLLGWALQAVLGLVGGGVDVLDGQNGALEEPFSVGAGVSIVGHAHDERFPSICYQILVGGFDFWYRCRW